MVQDFVLIHKKGSGLDGLGEPWVFWKTCLRQIAFGLKDFSVETDIEADVYRGEAAYSFLLEVVCGLKSPLAGETEVMGQYREILSQFKGPKLLQKILEAVLVDAKAIRHAHLSKLGSQSYGSLCRKILSELKSLHVLGAGQFTEELLPWFSDKKTVYVHGRHIENRAKLARDFSYVHLVSLAEGAAGLATADTALIVAAPMSSSEIRKWVGDKKFTTILDLRGESRLDPIQGLSNVVSLKDFYQNLENHQAQIRDKVELAKADITRLASEKSRQAELRPFGWDDLCA